MRIEVDRFSTRQAGAEGSSEGHTHEFILLDVTLKLGPLACT